MIRVPQEGSPVPQEDAGNSMRCSIHSHSSFPVPCCSSNVAIVDPDSSTYVEVRMDCEELHSNRTD